MMVMVDSEYENYVMFGKLYLNIKDGEVRLDHIYVMLKLLKLIKKK